MVVMSSDSGILRTRDPAFVNSLDYPYQPNYIALNNPGFIGDGKTKIHLHYLDEGNKNIQETILLLHGEPSWSYLYRHFIPLLKQYRDWGRLTGLQLVGTNGIDDRFARVVVANGGLPTGDGKVSDAFIRWQEFASQQIEMDVGSIIQFRVIRDMKSEEIDAYNAPFPNERYQSRALVFPQLIPTRPDNPSSQYNRNAWENLKTFKRPFLTLFSDSDTITDKLFRTTIQGAKNQPHATITQAAHFLQEDKPHEIVRHIVKFIQDNPLIKSSL